MTNSTQQNRHTIFMLEDDEVFVEDFKAMSINRILPPPMIHSEASADAALARLGDTAFFRSLDLIIVDLKLGSGKSGIEFLDSIRSSLLDFPVPVVVLTDLDRQNITIRGRRYDPSELSNRGINKVLSKSILFTHDIEEVYSTLFVTTDLELDKTSSSGTISFENTHFAIFKAGLMLAATGGVSSIAGIELSLHPVAIAGSGILMTGIIASAYSAAHSYYHFTKIH